MATFRFGFVTCLIAFQAETLHFTIETAGFAATLLVVALPGVAFFAAAITLAAILELALKTVLVIGLVILLLLLILPFLSF